MRLLRRIRTLRANRLLPRWYGPFRWTVTIAVLVSLVTIILESGFRLALPAALRSLIHVLDYAILVLFAADVAVGYVYAPSRWKHFKKRWLDFAIIVPVVISLLTAGSGLAFIVIRQVVIVGQAFTRTRRFAGLLERFRLQPVAMMALSFVGLIVAGTLLLAFPAATGDGHGTPLLDALFTATSATCVTGLIVRDTPVFFSRFGQLVILGLIQLGGLGIMTFSASLAAIFGRRLGAARRRVVADLIEESRNIDIGRTLRYIVLFTFTAEALGTLFLFLRWLPEYPNPWYALYVAAFHSVSAFCNAGFSLFPDSLVHYAADPAVNLVIIGLIISGGLGFVVVHEMLNRETVRRGPVFSFRKLTVHSRMVLWTSGLLTLAGTVLFFFFEYDGVLTELPIPAKLVASLFQAVTPRTAGFNTVSMAGLKPITLLMFLALMFIGASPGSTGGGVKTSTFAVLFLAVRSRIRGRQDVEVHGRVVPKDIVYRATAIAVTSAAIVAGFFILLLATEAGAFQDILFETTSAFGTVGLSTGLTPLLSPLGRMLVVLLMYIGRLGPLTLALAMRARVSRLPIEYPSTDVMVG